MATTRKRSLVSRAGAAARKAVARGSSVPAKKGPAKAVKKAAPAKKKAATTAAKKAAQSAPAKKAAKRTPAKGAPAKKVAKKTATAKKPAKKPTQRAATKTAPAKKATKKTAKKTAKKATKKTAGKAVAKPAKKPARKAAPAPKKPRKAPARRTLVVLEAEDPWTRDELAEVRNQLKADVKRLSAELAEVQGDLDDLMRGAGEGAGSDTADVGSATFERDQEMTIVNNARDMLVQSERALARISAKTYGVCEVCGNPIGKNRLMVFPRATLCMTCKQREERR